MSDGLRLVEMQRTAVGWMPEVPRHWEVVLLRLVARIESGHTPSRSKPEYWVPEECVIPWVSLSDVWQLRNGSQKYITEVAECVSEEGIRNSSARLLPADTVVLSRTASVGFAGIMPRPMATTQDFVNWICGPRLLPEYLLWMFRAMRPEFDRLMMGSTHQTIYMPDVWQFKGPLPPLAEQRAIADFLDRKTAAIDAVIAEQRVLLDRLAEQRAAVINRAVTRGLDGSAAVKRSGVPWIGQIPTNWSTHPLKHVSTLITSGSRGWSQFYSDKGPIFLRISNVSRTHVDLLLADLQRVNPPPSSEGTRTRVAPDDLLISITADIGSVGVVPDGLGEAYVSQHIALVRCKPDRIDARFLAYSLASSWGQTQFEQLMQGGTKVGLTLENVRNLTAPLPPLDEQRAIAGWLDTFSRAMDAARDAITAQITRLQEYRQSVITHAVTGRLSPEL